jgi:hypothetical protein
MEQLQVINQSLENKIKLTKEQIGLAFELEQLNELYAPFKLLDADIARWAKRINEMQPSITPEILNEIVLNFITGKYTFSKHIGIANIFRGYSLYKQKGFVC